MLRNWHSSSLKKIVPSENKGAKVLCKSVEGKKGLYHKRESFGRSGLFPGARCSGPVAIPLLIDQPWSVWMEMSFCRQVWGTHLDSHLQWMPWRPKLARAPGGSLCAARGPGLWEQAKSGEGPTVLLAQPNRTELHVWIICSASNLTTHSLNTVLSSEMMKGNLSSLAYLLLTQKCQNWMHLISNKSLLCSTGNYIQNPMIIHNGKEYIYKNLFLVKQKLTQHCKPTTFQKNNPSKQCISPLCEMETSWGELDIVKTLISNMVMILWQLVIKGKIYLEGKSFWCGIRRSGLRFSSTT